ncbi:MAG: nucleotidyltransferase family protein [Patescibacteria group bacterium]
MTKVDILDLIKVDVAMMNILAKAEKLNLPDWLIGAGFVRNKVWNHLSGRETDHIDTADIDLAYFDPTVPNDQKKAESLMRTLHTETGLDWELRNNAYEYKSGIRSIYTSAEDVIATWPETATAVGVKIENGNLKLIAPYGIKDLVNFIIRPSPKYRDGMKIINQRIIKKKWLEKWPKLKIIKGRDSVNCG